MSDNRSSNFLQEAFQKHMRTFPGCPGFYRSVLHLFFPVGLQGLQTHGGEARHDQSVEGPSGLDGRQR